jgi:hypothetical protein
VNTIDDLRVGMGIALNSFELPELSEANIAAALRSIAQEQENRHEANFLIALADAFDHPDPPVRAKMVWARRGKPEDPRKGDREQIVGRMVEQLLTTGLKQEAAVAEVMQRSSLSRATVLRYLKRYRQLRALANLILAGHKSQKIDI